MVYNWLDIIRNSLFPPQCRLCLAPGTQGQDLCEGCYKELPWLGKTCKTCALPLRGEVTDQCPVCLNTPPALDACYGLFAYQPPVDDWIHALKFRQDLAVARLLGKLLADHPDIASRADTLMLLPVPMHRKRLAQRGYNQAQELARPLLKAGHLAAHCDCRRTRHTEAQSTLDKNERSRNLRGVFNVTSSLKDQSIMLVDDVMTTGTTLNELATELKRAGANRVEAMVVARTIAREH